MAEKPIKKVKKVIAKQQKVKELLDVSSIPGLKAIPIETRKFTQYDFDFTYPGCRVEIPKIDIDEIKDAIVKVNIKVNQDDAFKINVKELFEFLSQHAYVVKPIVPSVLKKRRARIKKLTADISPLRAVEVWLLEKKHKDADEVQKIAENIIRKVGAI